MQQWWECSALAHSCQPLDLMSTNGDRTYEDFGDKQCGNSGADPGFDRGGGGVQIVTGLKLPFWGLSFVEFWCWGLIIGGQGGPGPRGPPWIRPCNYRTYTTLAL